MAQSQQKYDRQIRIWGEHGQRALEKAKVCLLNAGPTGTETLKNLVLGGMGSFTVVDEKKVDAADLGNNFLVDYNSLGSSRAATVCGLLQELNPTCSAAFVEESPATLIDTNEQFFNSFTLIIATQIAESSLVKLDRICRKQNIILLVARSYGLVGMEHYVVESKPDNPLDDLRLHNPWPELKEFAAGFDVDTSDTLVHGHIPFAVLLLRCATEWKSAHKGRLPDTSAERREFKELVGSRRLGDGDENYREAMAAAFKVWASPTVNSDLQKLFSDSAATVTASSPNFWLMVDALKSFVYGEGGGEVPLDGAIPDMHSLTEFYVQLQQLFARKADADVNAVHVLVQARLKSVGRDPGSIDRATVKKFCKNARNLKVLRYNTLEEEFKRGAASEMLRLLGTEEGSNAAIYLLLRAADHFAAAYNRFPGVFHGDAEEEDVARLKSMALGLLAESGAGAATIPEDMISEVCRFGAGEIHNIAAVIGGIAAQEAIKVKGMGNLHPTSHSHCLKYL